MEELRMDLEEEAIDPVETRLRQLETERDLARAERDFARQQYSDLGRLLRDERDIFAKELRKVCARQAKSIVVPTLWFASFIALALIVSVLMDYQLVSPLLGEPLSYVSICFCTLFFGVMFERISVKFKKKNRFGKEGM